ncbi:MAG: ABC transporter permease [Deltaproteobacteria bacterium]|nr:ABC transporter permease [Deltaproteobacteria bacterium]
MNFRYVWKELRHHHHRTLVNILGIGIGIALFVSINAVSSAYKEAVSLPFKNLGADLVVQRPEKRAVDSNQSPASMRGIRLPFSNQILPSADLEKLKSLEGVESMASSLLLWEFEQRGFRTIMGVDLEQPSLGPVKVKDWLKDGRFPQNRGEVVLEKHYAKFHQARLGDSFSIGNRSFKVVGLLEIKEGSQIASANIYLSLADAATLLPEESRGVNIVYLRLKDPSLLPRVKSKISRELDGVSVTSSDSFLELMGGVSKISDQFSLLASMIALGGAIFLIIKSMLSNLVERSREIGILKAVGWTEKDVQKQLMGEVLLQSFMGGVCGIVGGYLISYLLGFFSIPITTPWEVNLMPAFAKDTEAAAQVVQLPVSVSAGLMAISLALSLAAGVLASLAMGRRTARMKPADILRKM